MSIYEVRCGSDIPGTTTGGDVRELVFLACLSDKGSSV